MVGYRDVEGVEEEAEGVVFYGIVAGEWVGVESVYGAEVGRVLVEEIKGGAGGSGVADFRARWVGF
jgi:hypothetical protein